MYATIITIRMVKSMRKRLFFVGVLLLLLNAQDVFATGGGLRKNSIKTCPDGVTYGMHGDGNGGTHWHRAATNGTNYYAVDGAIYSDPCPGSVHNEGTAERTNGGSSNSSNSGGSNYYNNTQPSTPVAPVTPEPVQESAPVVSEQDSSVQNSSENNSSVDESNDTEESEVVDDEIDSDVEDELSGDSDLDNNDSSDLDDDTADIIGWGVLGGLGYLLLKKKKKKKK